MTILLFSQTEFTKTSYHQCTDQALEKVNFTRYQHTEKEVTTLKKFKENDISRSRQEEEGLK